MLKEAASHYDIMQI